MEWEARGTGEAVGLLLCKVAHSAHRAGSPLLLLSRCRRVRLRATPEAAAHQAPPALGFSRQEHWSGLSFPSPVDIYILPRIK